MTTPNGESKMDGCPMCEANMKVLEACEKYVPGVTRFFRPCPSCSAPPVSSAPGEPKPEAEGPYKFYNEDKFGGAHLIGPGIEDFPVEVWFTRDNLLKLGDIAYAEGRASLMVELESVTHAHHLLTLEYAGVIAELEAAVGIIEGLLTATKDSEPQDHEVEKAVDWLKARGSELPAALTPSKEEKL